MTENGSAIFVLTVMFASQRSVEGFGEEMGEATTPSVPRDTNWNRKARSTYGDIFSILFHNFLVTYSLCKCNRSLLNPPQSTRSWDAFIVSIWGYLCDYEMIHVPPIRTQQLTLMLALTEVRALKVCNRERGVAVEAECNPLRRQAVMRSNRSETVVGSVPALGIFKVQYRF